MTKNGDLPKFVLDALRRETAGSVVRWAGRPDPHVAFRRSMAIWLFAIPWTAFALFWTAGAAGMLATGRRSSGLNGFALFGLPFIGIGIAMLSTPFWQRWTARRTGYAVTDQRLVTVSVRRAATVVVKSIDLRSILDVTRTEHADGTGNLKIVTGWRKDSDGDRVPIETELVGIPDVRLVDDLLRVHFDSPPSLSKPS